MEDRIIAITAETFDRLTNPAIFRMEACLDAKEMCSLSACVCPHLRYDTPATTKFHLHVVPVHFLVFHAYSILTIDELIQTNVYESSVCERASSRKTGYLV